MASLDLAGVIWGNVFMEQSTAENRPPDVAPGEIATGMTPEELAEARQYGKLQLITSLADKLLDVVVLAFVAFFVARPVGAWLASFEWLAGSATARLAGIFLVTYGLHLLVSFPLSFYSGHLLEHRFGLSQQTLGRWLWRYLKLNGLSFAFGLTLLVGLYWIIWLTGPWWWLVAAAGFFVVSVLVGQLMPVLILPLFYKVERIDDPQLNMRMQKLSAGTGLSIEGVYRLGMGEETRKANALLAGMGRTRRVLIGDTLLESFSPDEIEVIFAHEVGHHVFGHIRKMILTGLVWSTVGFWICDRVLLAWARQFDPNADYANLPIETLPMLMLMLTVFGLLLEPLGNIISRRYERQCDRYALERTGLKAAYVSAFSKLAQLNKADPDPHPLEVFLFHSHPPITERLALAESD
jgi:STE24 endopeptidase